MPVLIIVDKNIFINIRWKRNLKKKSFYNKERYERNKEFTIIIKSDMKEIRKRY